MITAPEELIGRDHTAPMSETGSHLACREEGATSYGANPIHATPISIASNSA
jgi:hypothetical protein